MTEEEVSVQLCKVFLGRDNMAQNLHLRKSLGWSLIVFSSVINATYGLFAYGNDLLSNASLVDVIKNKMIFFFLSHILIVLLIFRQSLIEDLELSRKYVLYTTRISIIVSAFLVVIVYDIQPIPGVGSTSFTGSTNAVASGA